MPFAARSHGIFLATLGITISSLMSAVPAMAQARAVADPAGGSEERHRVGAGRGGALGAGGVATLLLVVELAPRLGFVDARFLPPTSQILAALAERLGTPEFWIALGQTLTTWFTGLAISLVAGVVLGVVIGSVPVLRAVTASTIEFLRPVPSVALIPLAILLYGTGMASTLLLVVYASFWQVLVQVLSGVQDVDPVASDTARSYRFSALTRIRTVVWPTTVPYAMTGLRLAADLRSRRVRRPRLLQPLSEAFSDRLSGHQAKFETVIAKLMYLELP